MASSVEMTNNQRLFHASCFMLHDTPKIIFLGTPEFALPALEALIKHGLAPAFVITQPDKPVGRKQNLSPPPVKALALANNLEVLQPENKKELQRVFNENEADVCVLVAYGMIVPDDVIDKPRPGFLNLHPSLLPKYRGSSPIQTALLNGDKKTGISIIRLTNQVDAGPILVQRELAVQEDDNAEILHDKLANLGAELLIEILPKYLSGEVEPVPQDGSKATYTEMIKREDGAINWSKTALEIKRQFRAFYPWPGIFTHLDKKRLKIANLSVLEGDFKANLAPGQVFLGQNQELAVKCGDGAVSLISVQLEGKKEMTAEEFLRGQKELVGKILE